MTTRKFTIALALLLWSGEVHAGSEFLLNQVKLLAMARIDPIVSPGKVAGHVHSIFGASNFNSECLVVEEMLEANPGGDSLNDDEYRKWCRSIQ